MGISIVEKLVLNDEDYELFKDEVKDVALMLQGRSLAFIEEASKIGLEMLPYERGFFVPARMSGSLVLWVTSSGLST